MHGLDDPLAYETWKNDAPKMPVRRRIPISLGKSDSAYAWTVNLPTLGYSSASTIGKGSIFSSYVRFFGFYLYSAAYLQNIYQNIWFFIIFMLYVLQKNKKLFINKYIKKKGKNSFI